MCLWEVTNVHSGKCVDVGTTHLYTWVAPKRAWNLCVCVMEAEAVSMQWTGGDYVSGEEASQLMCVWGLGGGLLQGLSDWSMCSKPPPQGCLTNTLTQCHKRKKNILLPFFFFQR